jgi:hypothetical protein
MGGARRCRERQSTDDFDAVASGPLSLRLG